MDQSNINKLLDRYFMDYNESKELEERLLTTKDKEEWQKVFLDRSRKFVNFIRYNENVIEEVFKALREPLTEETAAFWYEKMVSFFKAQYIDSCVLPRIIAKIMPYYESRHDMEHLIRVYEAAVSVSKDTFLAEDHVLQEHSVYAAKVRSLTGEYANIKDPRGRIVFFLLYHNILQENSHKEKSEQEPPFSIFVEAVNLWNSDVVQKLDKDLPMAKFLMEEIQHKWVNLMIEEADSMNPAAFAYFSKLVDKFYQEEAGEHAQKYQYDYSVYCAYLAKKIVTGEISHVTAGERLFQYYAERLSHITEELIEDESEMDLVTVGRLSPITLVFLADCPITIVKWIGHNNNYYLPDEMLEAFRKGTEFIFRNTPSNNVYDNQYNGILSEYCSTLIPYLRTREEKEDWLLNLVVRRQLPTFIHCCMVKYIAFALFNEMYRDIPAIFADVEKLAPRQDLLAFLSKCALFHDVGKNGITTIINMQTRALRNNELQLIKSHPDIGYKIICENPDFSQYRDIVLGHHKYYNGSGGYPDNFDNTKSPYRSLIDLITICDCIDAGTDQYGRNYKAAKTFDTILNELWMDKGIKYNPVMVNYLLRNKPLQDKIRKIVEEDRINVAYDIYINAPSVGEIRAEG